MQIEMEYSPLPPQDSGKLYATVHRFVKEAPMAETRITYHKEVKTASFQGRPITLENLTPILSPKAQDKRKGKRLIPSSPP